MKSTVVSSEIVLPLLNLGAKMSNLCFHLKQDETIPSNTRRVMGELQAQWDAARRNYAAEVERQNDKLRRGDDRH